MLKGFKRPFFRVEKKKSFSFNEQTLNGEKEAFRITYVLCLIPKRKAFL